MSAIPPPPIILDPLVKDWLREDLGRGDRTTMGLLLPETKMGKGQWIAKQSGVVAGLPIAARVFQTLNPEVKFVCVATEGQRCNTGDIIASVEGSLNALLMGERVALNLGMRLSGIATLTREYVDKIADLPTQFVDTRKTIPGLRILEKYAIQVGGGINHRLGLDDAVMIKDNHIQAAGGIEAAVAAIKKNIPYPMTIEVETSNLRQVEAAVKSGVDIIMLDNMAVETMYRGVEIIRHHKPHIKIEASGNITLKTIRAVAQTGVDYISSSAPITRSSWLDISMRLD